MTELPSVADLVNSCGILPPDSSMDAVGAFLKTAASRLNGSGPQFRALVEQELKVRLSGVNAVTSPAELIKVFFRPAGASDDDALQGQALVPKTPELWQEAVDGGRLLTDIASLLQKYLVLPSGALDACVAWIVATHAVDAFDVAPILLLRSVTKRCGKTQVLTLLHELTPRPLSTVSASPAALFRSIEAFNPTLLIDEAEVLGQRGERSEALRQILAAGYSRGACVPRCVGNDHELRTFDVFGFKAVAAIGRVHDTIEDRSIVIKMERKRPNEHVARLRRRQLRKEADALRQQAARWAKDNAERLRRIEPELPEFLNDRQQDCWEPLLAVGIAVGVAWESRLVAAAKALTQSIDTDDETFSIELLRDVRDVLSNDGKRVERVSSGDLVDGLVQLEDRPWSDMRHGKQLNKAKLARLLKPFEIRPKQLWLDGQKNVRGYETIDFDDAFARYLPDQALDRLEVNGNNELGRNAGTLDNRSPSRSNIPATPCDTNTLAPLAASSESDNTGPPDPSDEAAYWIQRENEL